MKRVVVFGVFDLLHPGHLYFLREAKKHGAHLTVVVTRDARVAREKKRKPIFNGRERLQMVRAIRWVDHAILGDKVGEWKILARLKPDVICVGYDQKVEWVNLSIPRKRGSRPKIVRIRRRRTKKYRSTTLRAR